MSRETIVFDTGEIDGSLVSTHLCGMMKQVGADCEIAQNLRKDSGAILLTYRSPQPGFVNSLVAIRDAGLSIYREERTETDPLLIAGGTAMINPFPLKEFMDAFWLGDATILTFNQMGRIFNSDTPKNKKLEQLRQMGFYVPGLVVANEKPVYHYAQHPEFARVVGRPTKKNYNSPEQGNTTAYFEVKKGCGMGCAFCIDANNQCRTMSLSDYELMLGLTLRDFPDLDSLRLSFPSLTKQELVSFLDITERLIAKHEAHFSVNLGSTMPHHFDREVAARFARLGQRVMTFAPEVAEGNYDGMDLRRTYKTWLTDGALMKAVESGVDLGINELVLYHLTGFPGETDAHIEAFAKMVKSIGQAYRQLEKISVIAGPVFPTVGTSLETAPQITYAESMRRWELFAAMLDGENRICPLWILDMPPDVRYNETGAGADVFFCQAYFHRANERMGEAIAQLSAGTSDIQDVFRLGVAAHETAMCGAGIDIAELFGANNVVTSKRLARVVI